MFFEYPKILDHITKHGRTELTLEHVKLNGKTANSLKESSVALHRSIGSVRDVVNCCQATIRIHICDAGKINGQIWKYEAQTIPKE